VKLQAVLYGFFLGLARLAQWVPRRAALAMGAAFAGAVYRLYRLTPYRHFIEGNLQAAYPGMPNDEAQGIAKRHLQNLTRCIVEVMRLPLLKAENLHETVRFEGFEHLEAARAEGKGVIIATAHFGNWEILGGAIALSGIPLHVLAQRPSQDAFDRLFKEFRGRVGVSTWENSGPASLRPVLRALARNEALGLLVDQHGEAQDAIVNFFGHAVSAPTGPFYFARRTGATVLTIFAIRQPDDTHVLRIGPPIPVTDNPEQDCQALYAAYEAAIRENPDHWLWVHDRWAREHELTRAPLSKAPAREPVEAAS
jgi:KDO2-lipid IV(A) lauroyltransferase